MAPAGCHTHRHASHDSYYKNMIDLIHPIYFIRHILLAISHYTAYAAKQVRRPLIVVASFLRGCYRVLARMLLTYAKTTT